MRKILSSVLLTCTLALAAQELDVDKQLHYCHSQVMRALAELQGANGYDFSQQPRNILSTDKLKVIYHLFTRLCFLQAFWDLFSCGLLLEAGLRWPAFCSLLG